jgi:WD40 repeat protein
VLDLTTIPPSFRATGPLGFAGTISNNYSPKIAVAENAAIAYALGNATVNQFVRVFDVSSDPTGIVTWPTAGDIPIAQEITPSVGRRDMEVLENNALLFVTSGASSSSAAVVLDVFDVSGVPSVLPTTPIQTLSFAAAGGGAAGLDLSPDGSKLALLLSADAHANVTLYDITVGAPQPLVFAGSFTFQNFTGSLTPNDVHFSPDGNLLFVSGGNGYYSVVDMTASSPTILVDGALWSTNGTATTHGSAVGIRDGALVAVLGDPATTGGALYNVLDLNTTSLGFGQSITSFSTNPGANISNHRSHARQSIVIAIDGTGATANCQFVDVIDLAQPAGAGFVAWRVQMPSTTSLTPPGLSCIPRDFDLF